MINNLYFIYNICTYTNLNMKGYVKMKNSQMNHVQCGHICMHGIKRLFMEGLPVSMAIRQSVN